MWYHTLHTCFCLPVSSDMGSLDFLLASSIDRANKEMPIPFWLRIDRELFIVFYFHFLPPWDILFPQLSEPYTLFFSSHLPDHWIWLFWPLILPHNFNIAVSWAGCVPLFFSLYPLLRQPCPFPMTFHTSCTQNLCIYDLDLSSAPEALNPAAVWIFSLGYSKGYRSKPNLSWPSWSAPLSFLIQSSSGKCPLPSSSVSINSYVNSYM